MRTVCRIRGKKNGTKFLNKIKTQSLATLITRDLEINFDGMKKFKNNEKIEEEDFVLNLFEYIKSFAFLKFSDIKGQIKLKDIFIAVKCIDLLMKIDSERNKIVYEKQKLFRKNQIFIKNQLNFNPYSAISEKTNFGFKNSMIFELNKFKEFTNNLIEKIKIENKSEISKKENYKIQNIYEINFGGKKLNFSNENVINHENENNFDTSVLLLYKKFKKE